MITVLIASNKQVFPEPFGPVKMDIGVNSKNPVEPIYVPKLQMQIEYSL